jgi:hypothetical protein
MSGRKRRVEFRMDAAIVNAMCKARLRGPVLLKLRSRQTLAQMGPALPQARYGKITPDEAEAEAKASGFAPFGDSQSYPPSIP